MGDNASVGDVMSRSRKAAAKGLAILLGVVVYAAMLAYTGVHNYSLMTLGVREDMLIWALLGVFTLEISGIAFPLALHFWTFETLQKWVTLLLYGLDLMLLVLNTVLDYSLTAGTATSQLPWLQQYFAFVVPATPVISGVSWTLIFLLDPAHKQRALTEELAASTREALARKIVEAARATEVNDVVAAAARQMTQEIVRGALGVYAPPASLPSASDGRQVVYTVANAPREVIPGSDGDKTENPTKPPATAWMRTAVAEEAEENHNGDGKRPRKHGGIPAV